MISCKLYGGTGNNLFQIAATIAHSLKHMEGYCIPAKINNPHYEDQKVFYSKYLRYCKDGVVTATVYKEPFFHYQEIPAPISKYTLLEGYFQSYKYFDNYREDILKILDIPYEFKKGKCAIHIRRGDYLNLSKHHNVVSNIYLQDAQLKIMNEGVGKFEVYSDDISWCRKHLPQYDNADYEFIEGQTEVEDLAGIASCEHVVMSASSFSWFGAWLGRNENRIVIYPKQWFPKSVLHDTKDLCPDTWIKI